MSLKVKEVGRCLVYLEPEHSGVKSLPITNLLAEEPC